MGATFIKAPFHAFSAPAVLAKLIKANDDGGGNDDTAAAEADVDYVNADDADGQNDDDDDG